MTNLALWYVIYLMGALALYWWVSSLGGEDE